MWASAIGDSTSGASEALLLQARALRLLVRSIHPEPDMKTLANVVAKYVATPDVAQSRRLYAKLGELLSVDVEDAIDREVDPIPLDELKEEYAEELRARAAAKLAFAERLKREMAKAGLTQRVLAEKIGVSQSCISQFASGEFKPQPKTLQKLAKALRCTVDDLWPAS